MILDHVVDDLIALAALAVAAWFLVAWRRIGEPAFGLFAVGLALKGVGYALSGPMEFGLATGVATGLEVLTLAILLAGNLVMVSAYLGGHGRRGWLIAGVAAGAGAILLGLLDIIVPPAGEIDRGILSPTVHAVVALANVGCALFALQGFRASPHPLRAVVPAAFFFWGLSNYTWLMIDFGAPGWLGALVQAWRVGAIALMLVALVAPAPRREVAVGPS